ncbi:MAG: cupin domain-containing protein [Halodesulfurarchaeum sp.]
MGYHVLGASELDPTPDRPSVQRAIADAAGLEQFGLNLYEPDPGEQVPLSYHYHTEQEEALYVIEGSITVETPEGEHSLARDEIFIAEPESPHRAYNPEGAERTARVLAVGAPRVSDAEVYEP